MDELSDIIETGAPAPIPAKIVYAGPTESKHEELLLLDNGGQGFTILRRTSYSDGRMLPGPRMTFFRAELEPLAKALYNLYEGSSEQL